MKKIIRSIFTTLSIGAIFTASLPLAVNAAEETIQPRGSYHVYGDINNDGIIIGSDATMVLNAVTTFEKFTGSRDLPLEYAIARPSIYFGNIQNPVPQAADTNGDAIINDVDAQDILNYYTYLSSGNTSGYNGNCGKTFFIP